jgi:hypothetical protein
MGGVDRASKAGRDASRGMQKPFIIIIFGFHFDIDRLEGLIAQIDRAMLPG